MARFSLLLTILISLPLWAVGLHPLYTLKDLEILVQEANYEEFFEHALDILPSERLDSWKGMVSKMADGHARQILSRSELTEEQFLKIESLYSWPTLKTDDVFKVHRQDIGLKFLKGCLKASKNCWKLLQSFWEADQSNPETAFKLAEITLGHEDLPISTWSFLEVAIKSPLSEFYCKKDFVLDAIWGKLEIDYIRLGSSGNLLKKVDETLHPECLYTFNQWIQNKLMGPDKPSDRELAFQILNAQGKTNLELTDFFYTVYLLESPSKGELFNYAWNRLGELSKSVDRREKVLEKIKSLDPLPDALFSSLDETKKRAILTHFKNKFPEYLYFYTDQCLLFYEGKGTFPKGNPTMKCPDLMQSEVTKQLVGEDRVQKFNQIRSL